MNNWIVSTEERKHLRELAKKQLKYSMLPIMKEREDRWYRHNDLKGEIPMIHFETWTFENDILPAFKCTSEAAKAIELQLNRTILNHECIDDDRVVPSWYTVGWDIKFLFFDMKIEREHSKDSHGRNLGHQFKYRIKDLKEDMHLLRPSTYSVDRERTIEWKNFVEDILGDILPVRMGMSSLVCSPSQQVVHMMGMENMLFSIIDYPDEFHELMNRISRDYIDYIKWMEKEGLFLLNNGNDWLAQGSFGFTRDLPGKGFTWEKGITTRDLWGYMDSQETVGVSPEMFDEFFFPYFQEIANEFGMLSYGCCEPVHAYWEKSLSKLSNLRKISISPWCNEEYIGEVLRGSRIIYHRKPSPNFVGVGKDLDEDAFRQHIQKTVRCAKGCKLEFSFRDVYTLEGNTDKPRRAVQIVREVLEDSWK